MNNRSGFQNPNQNPNPNPLSKKHFLFYSNYCQFSNDVYRKIEKYGIKENFIFINISQKKYKIPTIITSVPTILLNDRKTLIQDEEIDNILNEINNTDNKEVNAFAELGGISNSFSFLDEDSNKNTTLNFGLIDSEFRIETPAEDADGGVNSGSISDKMNNMQEQRNSEIQDLLKK